VLNAVRNLVDFQELSVKVFLPIAIVLYCIIVSFGPHFDGTESQVKETANAQRKLSDAVLSTFHYLPTIEVAIDYSAKAYIERKNYMLIPYPHRAEAVKYIGKAWCDNPGPFRFLLPKVVLRDVQTGAELACYRCDIWGSVSIN
jgi:hypothetical protein